MGADAKPLVLCADDYAQHAGVTRAVLALAAQGRLTATSAMVLSPRWREDAAPLREWRDRLDVGLHLDFTSDFAVAAGHGLSLGAAMRRALLGGFDPAAARVVIERQLDAFEAAWGGPPDHVDGHQHVQQFAGIRTPLVQVLARRYGARPPWLRVSRPPASQRTLKSWVIASLGAGALEKIAVHARIPCAPALSGIYDFTGGEAGYAHRMAGWLAGSPAGTLLMCHPGAAPEATDGPDPIAAARAWEFAHFASAAFAAQCATAGVRLVRGSTLYPPHA
ncbi:ChbG/HpnK family deacetylase [Ottowia sp.]|uniref:ChbG/HpnK family deacetylase n=1 Tax=Ottowia sp. TaxID=1898956 RepID=UPI0025F3BD49|nr:ChbG/HpnK family deacetylase [Ottowia sp.]